MKSCLLSIGLVAAIVLTAQAVPYPGPGPFPYAMAGPSPFATAYAQPSCCGVGQACGLGLCGCCGESECQNGACSPIIPYADGFYGAPRIQGGYGNTYGYGR